MKPEYDILHGSRRLDAVPMSGIRMIMNKAKALKTEGKDVISFSAGEPNFDTPEPIKEATIQALRENYTHYASNWGETELRREIAAKIEADTGMYYDPETEVLVTCGGAEGINDVIYSVVDPGDEVLIFKPAFINYEALVRAAGGTVADILLRPENGFLFTAAEVEEKITERTKMIILNSPNNPTGVVYEKELLEELAALAVKHNLLVFSDEMYSSLTYEGAQFYSMAAFPGMRERTLIVNGFSKTYAMTGWRLGYVYGPGELMPKLVKNHQYTTTSICTFMQVGVARSMNLPETQAAVEQMKETFAKRRLQMMEGLSQIPKLSYVKPSGAFYIMVNVRKTGLTGEEFAERLLYEKYVATVPAACLGEHCTDYIRISFAASEEAVSEGLRRIREFVAHV